MASYDQMRAGTLAYLKVGRRHTITRQDLEALLGDDARRRAPSSAGTLNGRLAQGQPDAFNPRWHIPRPGISRTVPTVVPTHFQHHQGAVRMTNYRLRDLNAPLRTRK